MIKSFKSYAQFEKEELIFDVIQKYPTGIFLEQICKDLNVTKETVKKITKVLYKKRKIMIIRIGGVDIYAVRTKWYNHLYFS